MGNWNKLKQLNMSLEGALNAARNNKKEQYQSYLTKAFDIASELVVCSDCKNIGSVFLYHLIELTELNNLNEVENALWNLRNIEKDWIQHHLQAYFLYIVKQIFERRISGKAASENLISTINILFNRWIFEKMTYKKRKFFRLYIKVLDKFNDEAKFRDKLIEFSTNTKRDIEQEKSELDIFVCFLTRNANPKNIEIHISKNISTKHHMKGFLEFLRELGIR